MFYEIKKGDELLERFNHSEVKGKVLTQADKDAQAVSRAKELKADVVVTSDGRQVL
jgi:hypothetical protein